MKDGISQVWAGSGKNNLKAEVRLLLGDTVLMVMMSVDSKRQASEI